MKCFFILLFLSISFFGSSQNLQFYSEKIDFTISDNIFTVDGIYFFRNISADTIKQFMVYPFPQDEDLGEIISINATTLYPDMKIQTLVDFNQKAARFRLKILPNDTAIVHVIYQQAIFHQKAEYILTSTKAWNRPLENARFTLSIPIDHKIDSLSYNADSILFNGTQLRYKFYFEDFMPDRNFCVFFSGIDK